MKMSLETPVYVKPGNGETVYELANEIYELVQEGEQSGRGYKVFMIKPDETIIEIKGKTFTEIHGSIMTQCAESAFYYD